MKDKFLEYLNQYCYHLQTIKNYSPLTIKTYNAPIKESIILSEIYDEDGRIIYDITKYRIKISTQSNKTINKKLSSIRSFVHYLDQQNIKVYLQGSSSVKSEKTLPKPIETINILDTLEICSVDEKLIIALIYSLGIRISELSNIKIDDIKSDWITVLGKGDKQRQIPLNSYIKELLENYKRENINHIYLFQKDGKALTNRQLQYKIQKGFEKIGIKVTPHQLRHSFATDLLNNGARINDISLLLGHNSLKATSIYTKLNTNTKLKQYNNAHPLSKEIG